MLKMQGSAAIRRDKHPWVAKTSFGRKIAYGGGSGGRFNWFRECPLNGSSTARLPLECGKAVSMNSSAEGKRFTEEGAL